jgi:hypothetical protein
MILDVEGELAEPTKHAYEAAIASIEAMKAGEEQAPSA